MGRKVKIEVECDRCKNTQEVIQENKSRYGDFPEGWGYVVFKDTHDFRLAYGKEYDYLLCATCVAALKTWWDKK